MNKQELFIQLVESLSTDTLFHGHAVVDAEDEAMMVLMAVLDQNVDQILSTGEQPISEKLIHQMNAIVTTRLQSLKPMAYIIGEVYFCGLKFIIDERALVPRSPIAEVILNGFKGLFDIHNMSRALDLCTGSGCIGIAMAQHHSHLKVDISDLSVDALNLAQKNIDFHQLNNRVTKIESDLFTNINESYDLIASNPPYVSEEEYQDLPEEYKQEPKMGLVTAQSGLSIPVNILLQAPGYLKANGFLILEVGYSDDLLAANFPVISFQWLEFSNGGQGVCIFSREMLLKYHAYFKAFLEEQNVL